MSTSPARCECGSALTHIFSITATIGLCLTLGFLQGSKAKNEIPSVDVTLRVSREGRVHVREEVDLVVHEELKDGLLRKLSRRITLNQGRPMNLRVSLRDASFTQHKQSGAVQSPLFVREEKSDTTHSFLGNPCEGEVNLESCSGGALMPGRYTFLFEYVVSGYQVNSSETTKFPWLLWNASDYSAEYLPKRVRLHVEPPKVEGMELFWVAVLRHNAKSGEVMDAKYYPGMPGGEGNIEIEFEDGLTPDEVLMVLPSWSVKGAKGEVVL